MLAWMQLPCLIGVKPTYIYTNIPHANDIINYLLPLNKSFAYNIALDSYILLTEDVIKLFIHYKDVRALKAVIDVYPMYMCNISTICIQLNKLDILYQIQLHLPSWCRHMRDEFFTTYCPGVFLGLVSRLSPDNRRLCYIDAIKQDNVRYLKLLVDNYGWQAIIPYNVITCNALCCADYIKGYLVMRDIELMIVNRRWKLLYTVVRRYIFIVLLCVIMYLL